MYILYRFIIKIIMNATNIIIILLKIECVCILNLL